MKIYKIDHDIEQPVKPGDDAQWRELTEAGNTAFAVRQFDTAKTFYESALVEADGLFSKARLCNGNPESSVLLLVSAGNLAELFVATDQRIEAMVVIRDAVKMFLDAIEDPQACMNLRKTCYLNLNSALTEFVEYSDQAGTPKQFVTRIIRRARRAPLMLMFETETLQ